MIWFTVPISHLLLSFSLSGFSTKHTLQVLHKKTIGQTQAARDGLEANKKTCEMCYCFVCDGPASECQSWSGAALTAETAHCLAANRGANSSTWSRLRDEKKNPGGSRTAGNNPNASAAAALAAILAARSGGSGGGGRRGASWSNANRRLQDRLENLYGSRPGGSQSRAERMLAALVGGDDPSSPSSGLGSTTLTTAAKYATGKGPFKADDSEAAKCNGLTQCRLCKWRSAFEHRNFTRKTNIYRAGGGRKNSTKSILHPHKVGEEDWCHACGRIASTKDLGKEQSGVYRPLGTDTCLGTKSIPFTIKSHDPRKLDAFKDNWAEHEDKSPGWTYDAAEMEYDTFRHRIGNRPTLNMILASVPIVPEDEIPETGQVTNPLNKRSFSYNSYQKHNAANECEAVILESRNDRALFMELDRFSDAMERKNDDYTDLVYGRGTSRTCPIKANIQATWDKTERKGSFTVTLFLCQRSRVPRTELKNNCPRISLVLGCWFDVFPFTLADLSTGLQAKDSNIERRKEWMRHSSIPIPPYRHKEEAKRHEMCAKTKEEKAALVAYKPAARAVRNKLNFFSSAGTYGGGVSSTDTSLEGGLRRFFTEKLIDEQSSNQSNTDRVRSGWIGRSLKIVSHHRDMRKPSGSLAHSNSSSPTFGSYLRDEDHALLVENVSGKTRSIYERTKTFPGLMQHLENLGHKAAPQPEGINVELMDFQKQALAWAIERENTEGGLNSFLWIELPKKAKGVRPGYSNTLWFSPMLDMVTTQKPSTAARGGFICEQMGLGKTVISLSVVLQNPAPDLPESGTEVDGYKWPPPSKEPSSTPGWTQVVKKAAGAPSSRGSIFSRGTLVVCNVSLVGQWIDEAKSKLKNPGLVYSYHGGNRTRDASILAEKSIVVTTYATLASDNNYHKKKSKDEDAYCSPCEQVRWWRVICDESHVLRATSGQTRSVLNLQAENKWCVTGTPINTNVMDLKNQLSFIGLDDLNSMFSLLSSRMGHHNGGKPTGGRRRRWGGTAHEVGPFNFLMRSLLIRHTMEQKCRETNRDLMSLPEKTERVIKIDFSADERAEYDKLEAAAKNAYTRLKNSQGTSQLSRHYLRLHSYLLPLRMACSGGPLPEDDPFANDDDDDDAGSNPVHQMKPGDDIECSICLDALNEPMATQCKPHPHVFCKDCITGIIGINDDSSAACPLCRETVVAKKLCKAILPKIKDEDEPAVGEDCKAVFKSKFKRLLSELKKIRDNEPNAKSLIFSQFKSTLDYLKEELPKHGFQFRTLEGSMTMTNRAKALRQFQNDPPTTIFLLSMRAGAVGINLTQANRVFLMEPALNPALEAQAIGRVHRLGQKHKVEVLRLIMTESVETRMLKLSAKKFGVKFGSDSDDDTDNSSGDGAQKNDGDDDDDDRKVAASPSSSAQKKKKKKTPQKPGEVATGALRQDKAQMAADEFDLLFGVGEGAPAAAAAAAAAPGEAAADANADSDDDDGDVAVA